MRQKTRDFVMSLSNDQLYSLGMAGEYGVKNHLSNIRHVANVPKYSFSPDYSGVELSHKAPAPKAFGQSKSDYFGKRNELVAKAAPPPAPERTFDRQLDLLAGDDYETGRPASALAPRPSFAGMRR